MSSLPWISSVHYSKLFSKKKSEIGMAKAFQLLTVLKTDSTVEVPLLRFWKARGGSLDVAMLPLNTKIIPRKSLITLLKRPRAKKLHTSLFFFQSQEWCLFWASWPVFLFGIFSESFLNSSLESMFLLFCLAFVFFCFSPASDFSFEISFVKFSPFCQIKSIVCLLKTPMQSTLWGHSFGFCFRLLV